MPTKNIRGTRAVTRSKGRQKKKTSQRSSGRDRRVGVEGAVDLDRAKPGVSSEVFDREDAARYRRLSGEAKKKAGSFRSRSMGTPQRELSKRYDAESKKKRSSAKKKRVTRKKTTDKKRASRSKSNRAR